MKTFYIFFLSMALLGISPILNAQNFYLHPNGVTCMCPDAAVGETGVVNGVTYTKRNRFQITPQNAATTCTSGITDMSALFYLNQTFNQNISTWDVSNVNNMAYMFQYATAFNQPIGDWNVSNVTNMRDMFSYSNFNQPIGNWNVGNVTDMAYMFFYNSSFNQPIGDWNVSSLIDMEVMFYNSNFNQPIGDWNVSNVIFMNDVFWNNSNFNQDISTWTFNEDVMFSQQYSEGFISSPNFSIENYDLLLQSFSNQNLNTKTFPVANLFYCNTTARNNLINNKGWSITGDTFYATLITAPNDITINTDQGSCQATNVNLGTATGQSCQSFTISNNAPAAFPLGTTQVTWTILNSGGNTTTDIQIVTVVIEVDEVTVCYVTSDETEFTKNRIFINNLNWNNVDQYQVLRETSANVYDPIGIITQGQTSFLDATSNNLSQTYRYRVRALDICNNLYPSSPIHRTILLQSSVATNNSVNLLWNAYEGVSFGTYNIYRKVNDGDFDVIATLPSTNFTFNDTGANVLENTYQYYVAIEIPACVNGFNNVQIKSNRQIFDPNMSIGDILLNNQVILYPNPSSRWVTIQLNEDIQFIKGEVYNMLGQKVMDVNQSTFLITNLAASTYFIKIHTTQGTAVKTFIKR